MKWCTKSRKLLDNPPCGNCQVFCGVGWYTRGETRRPKVPKNRVTAGPGDFSKFTKYLISPFFMIGVVVLFWVPIIYLIANFSFTASTALTYLPIAILAALGIHELGHYLMTRIFDVEIEEWKFLPIGVGFKITEDIPMDTKVKIFSAGPMFNLGTGLVAMFLSGNTFFYFLAVASFFLFLMNSMPNRGRSDGYWVSLIMADSLDNYIYLYVATLFLMPIPLALLIPRAL